MEMQHEIRRGDRRQRQGLSVALNPSTRRVALIAKRSMMEGASDNAQGGIAAVLDSADSIENHVDDTLVAGGGLCDEGATRYIVEHGREAIEWLISQGVPFTKDDAAELGFHLTREGGLSPPDHPRGRRDRPCGARHAVGACTPASEHHVLRKPPRDRPDHVGPARPARPPLSRPVRARRRQRPHDHDRGPAYGARNRRRRQVYLYTTNPDTATGDGIAMAWRAGCRVSNMEFIQFHPTCLFHPYAKSFLISEAVRGAAC